MTPRKSALPALKRAGGEASGSRRTTGRIPAKSGSFHPAGTNWPLPSAKDPDSVQPKVEESQASFCALTCSGKRMVKVVPLPISVSKVMLPWCLSSVHGENCLDLAARAGAVRVFEKPFLIPDLLAPIHEIAPSPSNR